MTMQVRQLMSTPVVFVDGSANMHDVVGEMLDHRVGSVPVVNDESIGILTRSDVLRAVYHRSDSLSELPARVA